MKETESSRDHLVLRKTGQTFFQWKGQKYSVKDASPLIFDQWVRQFVDSVVNVDTEKWTIFHRWRIINAVLDSGLLIIVHLQSGDKLERPSVGRSEEKASASEVQIEEKASDLEVQSEVKIS